MIGYSTLSNIAHLRKYTSRRASSYDTTGGNKDWWVIQPGEERVLMESAKPGCVKHIWMTLGAGDEHFPRKIVMKMYWDGEENASVQAPVGDFFGMGHGLLKNFVSLPLQMSPQDGRGMNCWWPMPFNSARIAIQSDCEKEFSVYFYIDYEEYEEPLSADIARFHAQWRRENATEGWLTERLTQENYMDIWQSNPNLSDQNNYVILEAEGEGVYVGCNMHVDCYQRQGNDWYGEGDDMIVIDGEPWPPRMHGTGTEDYFNTAFCPKQEYNAPYHGITLYSGNEDWPFRGKNSMYRYHIEDPIRFNKSIRVSIEHGHSNKLTNDYASTAYWYQLEPHKPFELQSVDQRIPRPNEPSFP